MNCSTVTPDDELSSVRCGRDWMESPMIIQTAMIPAPIPTAQNVPFAETVTEVIIGDMLDVLAVCSSMSIMSIEMCIELLTIQMTTSFWRLTVATTCPSLTTISLMSVMNT
jgi:hypothetical protein